MISDHKDFPKMHDHYACANGQIIEVCVSTAINTLFIIFQEIGNYETAQLKKCSTDYFLDAIRQGRLMKKESK